MKYKFFMKNWDGNIKLKFVQMNNTYGFSSNNDWNKDNYGNTTLFEHEFKKNDMYLNNIELITYLKKYFKRMDDYEYMYMHSNQKLILEINNVKLKKEMNRELELSQKLSENSITLNGYKYTEYTTDFNMDENCIDVNLKIDSSCEVEKMISINIENKMKEIFKEIFIEMIKDNPENKSLIINLINAYIENMEVNINY